jgi:hypothetical protein
MERCNPEFPLFASQLPCFRSTRIVRGAICRDELLPSAPPTVNLGLPGYPLSGGVEAADERRKILAARVFCGQHGEIRNLEAK